MEQQKRQSGNPAIELAERGGEPLLSVTFEQPDGSSDTLNYADLRWVRYDPAESVVRLRFSGADVVIDGSNLLPAWRALRSRRVRYLRAAGAHAAMTLNDPEPNITSIKVTPVSGWELPPKRR